MTTTITAEDEIEQAADRIERRLIETHVHLEHAARAFFGIASDEVVSPARLLLVSCEPRAEAPCWLACSDAVLANAFHVLAARCTVQAGLLRGTPTGPTL